MKKAIKTIFIMSFLLLIVLVGKVDAASLDAIAIDTNKEIVNPGTELSLNINFGTSLGSFTFDINYDNNLLEYVSTNVGTANDNGSKVRIVFYDATGGTDPKDSLSVVFKAKEGLQTSNPTDLSITAEGLANADASVQYDDILVPIKKNIVFHSTPFKTLLGFSKIIKKLAPASAITWDSMWIKSCSINPSITSASTAPERIASFLSVIVVLLSR